MDNYGTITLDDAPTKVFQIAGVTGCDSEISELKRKIHVLGGEIIDTEDFSYKKGCTHILAKSFKPTEKILGALAAGNWILSHQYLQDSFNASSWLDELKYEYGDMNQICAYSRNRKTRPYERWKVHVSLSNRKRTVRFASILEAGGAEIITKDDIINKRLPSYVLSDQGSCESVRQLVGSDVPILDIGFLKDTLLLKKNPNLWKNYLIKNRQPAKPIPVFDLTGNEIKPKTLSNEIIDITNEDPNSSGIVNLNSSISHNLANSKRKTRIVVENIIPAFNPSEPINAIFNRKRTIEEIDLVNISHSSQDDIVELSPEKKVKVQNLDDSEIEILSSGSSIHGSQPIENEIDKCNISVISAERSLEKATPVAKDSQILQKPTSSKENEITPKLVLPTNSTIECPTKLIFESKEKYTVTKHLLHSFVRKSRRLDESIMNNLLTIGRAREKYKKIKNIPSNLVNEADSASSNLYASLPQHDQNTEDENSLFLDDTTEVLYMDSIDWLFSSLSPFLYPTAEHVGDFLKRFIGQCNWDTVEIKAITMAKRLLQIHPPSNSKLRNYYLKVLTAAAPNGYHENKPWQYVLKTIDDASEVCSSNNVEWQTVSSACAPLEFVLCVFKEDLVHWDGSRKSLQNLLLYQVIWKTSQNVTTTNNCMKIIIKRWVNSVNMHYIYRKYVTQLFEMMIEIIWLEKQKTDLITSSSCCPPPFLLQISHELRLRLKKLTGVNKDDFLLLARSLSSRKNRLYFSCIIYQMKFSHSGFIDMKMLGDSLKLVMSSCGLCTDTVKVKTPKSKPLVKVNKDVNKRNHRGETALFRACNSNNIARVKDLLRIPSIDVNISDYDNVTPLHKACILGHDKIVQLLLKYRPEEDENWEDCYTKALTRGLENETPLHDAIDNGHIEIVKRLLRYGGESLLSVKTNEGKTPQYYAHSEKMKKILSSYKGQGELKGIINKLRLKSLKGNHEEYVELITFLINAYLDAMGIRFVRQKMSLISKTKLKKELRSNLISVDGIKDNVEIIGQKSSLGKTNNPLSLNMSLNFSHLEDSIEILPCKQLSSDHRREKYSSDFEDSHDSLLDNLISTRRIVEKFEDHYKHDCTHTKYLELTLFV